MTDKYSREAPPPPEERWCLGTPDPETIQEHTYRTALPEGDILVHRFEQDDRDRLHGYAVMHMTWSGKGLEQVVRIDTRHQEVHLHQFGRGGVELSRRCLRIIQSLRDIEEGYDEALELITENWEEHKRRWQRGN